MSFSRELKDFAEGFESGEKILASQSDRRYRDAATKKIAPIQPGEEEGQPGIDGGGTVTITPGEGGGTGGTGKVDNDTNQVAARLKGDLMHDLKLSDIAAGGIVASLAAESGGFKTLQEISPTVKGSRGGWGYAQWTGPRRKAFEAYAQENGFDPSSYEANYGFLKRELLGPEGAILKDLANAKDYREATKIFTGSAAEGRGFLRPGKPNMSGRFAWADRIGGVEPNVQVASSGPAAPGDTQVASTDKGVDDALAEQGIDPNNPAADALKGLKKEEEGEEQASYSPDAGINYASVVDMTPPPSVRPSPLPGLPTLEDTLFAQSGGAIPEPRFADGGSTDDGSFGWGNILGGSGLLQAGKQGNVGSASDLSTGAGSAFQGANSLAATPVTGGGFNKGGFDLAFNRDAPAAATSTAIPVPATTAQPNAVQAAGNQAAAATVASNQAAANKAAVDAYNANRQTTQPVAKPAAATVAKPAVKPALTASQIAFNKLKAQGKAAPAATSPAPNVGGLSPAPQLAPRTGYALVKGGENVQKWLNQPGFAKLYQKAQSNPNSLTQNERNSLMAKGLMRRTSAPGWGPQGAIAAPKPKGYQEGGAIPDPMEDQSGFMFAKGGSVISRYWQPRAAKAGNRDDRFQQLLKEETRVGGSQRGADNSARDRAAKRLSREEGRPTSSAYKPGGGRKKGPGIDPIKTGESGPAASSASEPIGTLREDQVARDRANDPRFGQVPENVGAGPTVPFGRVPENVGAGPTRPIVNTVRPAGPIGDNADAAAIPEPDAEELPSRAKPQYPEPPKDRSPMKPRPTATTPAVEPAPALPEPPAPDVPVLPERIDLRPAPVSTQPAPAPAPAATGPDHAGLIKAAWAQIARGADAKAIGQGLINAGVPQELWPVELQNAFVGFAEGGAVPEPGEEGYNEAVAMGETAAPRQEMQPTPQLRNDVAIGLDGGVKFLKRIFNLGGEGAVPTPDDPALQQQGAQRLASGEGAATDQELAEIDAKIDPNNELDEAGKVMTRMAQVTNWYLSQGRKEDAETAAGSLVQAGARKFGRIGTLAAAAYERYQQSGDPEDLQAVGKFLQKAYDQIPNGANVNLTVDPETHTLQTTRTNADGQEETIDLKPSDIPGLIQQAQNGSYYWKEIFKLADPKGYESKLTEERQIAEGKRTDERWMRQHEITQGEELAKEKRTAEAAAAEDKRKRAEKLEDEQRANTEADRRAKLGEAFIRTRPKDSKDTFDEAALTAALPAMTAAQQAYTADDSEENKTALDRAASVVYEATGFDDQWMINNNMGPGTAFNYVGSGPAQPKQAPDGKWYVPNPDKPGKYLEVEPPGGTAAAAAPVS